MKNKEAKIILIREHGNICFLGGTVSKKNPITVHHLTPVRMGGQTVLVNLALLCRLEHDMFNTIESVYPKTAEEINDYFRYFKQTHDLEMLRQMREYVLCITGQLGYQIEDCGKILTLKRK